MVFLESYDRLTDRLRGAGDWIAPLGIRLLLAYEFWSAGMMKFRGDNWFGRVQDNFPFPFGQLPVDLNWLLATWGELLAAVALLLGLFTRFFAFTLIVITTVAIVAVHWPASWESLGQLWQGYSVSQVVENDEFRGNFRIPLISLAMMLPLVFWGGGKLSLDHALVTLSNRSDLVHDRQNDLMTAALALLVPGIIAIYLIPMWGIVLLALVAAAALYQQVR